MGMLSFIMGHHCPNCIGTITYHNNITISNVPQYAFQDNPAKVALALSAQAKEIFNTNIAIGVYYVDKNVYINILDGKKTNITMKTTSDNAEEICMVVLVGLYQYITKQTCQPLSSAISQ